MQLPLFVDPAVNLVRDDVSCCSQNRRMAAACSRVAIALANRRCQLALLAGVLLCLSCVAAPTQLQSRPRHDPWSLLATGPTGEAALNCTAARGTVREFCLVRELRHFAAATNATRTKTGKRWALQGFFLDRQERIIDPAAVTFYDDPVVLTGRAAWGQGPSDCVDETPLGDGPTVFAARDNPSPYHLLRIQLLPIFLALAAFELQHTDFQIVFIDGKPRDWATYVFDEAAGLPARLLHKMPDCFGVQRALLGVRYDDFPVSAHHAATPAELAAGRPLLTGFAAWLLQRFGVSHAAVPLMPAAVAKATKSRTIGKKAARSAASPGSSGEPGAQAQAGFAAGSDAGVCQRLRNARSWPLLTLVVRTGLHNGQGRRLVGTAELLAAAEACGFAAAQVDMAQLPFSQQLQTVANSSVLITVHGAATTLALALPPAGVSLELRPYKFDDSALYYHLFGNWAGAADRTHLVWHNDDVLHTSPGVALVDDYKNHDTIVTREVADRLVAAAAAALGVPLAQRNLDAPVLLNAPVQRCDHSHVLGNLVNC